jgi:hypothetical protein
VSTVTQAAAKDFATAMKDPHNLVWLHKNSQKGQGRRHRQPTLSRAVIVLTAAAWQAYIYDATRAALSHLAIPHGQQGHTLFQNVKANVERGLNRFNTPNAKNVVDLLLEVGFDANPHWTFKIGSPLRTYNVARVRKEIDGWLEIRHKLAHGASLPSSALISGSTKDGPSLHRADAERCIEFFEAVVQATDGALHQQFP